VAALRGDQRRLWGAFELWAGKSGWDLEAPLRGAIGGGVEGVCQKANEEVSVCHGECKHLRRYVLIGKQSEKAETESPPSGFLKTRGDRKGMRSLAMCGEASST